MIKFVKNKLKEEKGLTLIELLAVIVILGIIAAIAIPAIGNIIENSRYNAVKSDALNALSAANIYFAENSKEKDVTLATLADGYLEAPGKLPKTGDNNKIVKGENGLAITTEAITFSGSKTVTFKGATVESINADNTKGSSIDGNKDITDAVPTT